MSDKKNESGIRDKIMEACNIPKDTVQGYPITTIMGNNNLSICNYRGILEYNTEFIKVITKSGQIKIIGSQLEVEYYTNDEMKIIGEIQQIEFLKLGK